MSRNGQQQDYLTVRHAAELADTCDKTIRRWIALADDPLPAIKLSASRWARIRIPRRELIAWLDRRRAAIPTQSIVDEIVARVLA